jgi:predicted PurR-regulated permease PerM
LVEPAKQNGHRTKIPVANDARSGANSRNATLLAVVVVVAVLYFARVVLIPFVLAILFSFLLAPLVIRLRHWYFGRVLSVFCVVGLAFIMITLAGGLVTIQLSDLGHKLPGYQETIRQKIHSVRESSSGSFNRLSRVFHNLNQELTPKGSPQTAPGEVKPVPVEIRHDTLSPVALVQGILGSLFSLMVTASIVVVFVVFMLLQREDLRDRLLRLVGANRINLTTKALDDAAQRLSRYLLVQLGLNAGYGGLTGLGLFFMGVPNPMLWAVLAALFRYVPYLGIWLAAAMPAALALATGPGWLEPLGIFGLYFGIDLLALNFLEPLIYGNSTGISPMAILAAATFWTWLWGPIGLLLSTPLTVCLMVAGRHVPALEFLNILLGNQPALTPDKRFYQRLLAMDLEEATGIAEEFLKTSQSLEELHDQVIIPALALTEEDRHRGKLGDERQRSIVQNARFLVDDIGERADELMAGSSPRGVANGLERPDKHIAPFPDVTVLSMPARDEIDELAALLFAQLLARRGVGVKLVPAGTLASERLKETAQGKVQLVCVVAVPPFGYLHTRYLCKRLRAEFPELKIVAAILTQGDPLEMRKRDPQIPADEIVTSLQQALTVVLSLLPCAKEQPEQCLLSP